MRRIRVIPILLIQNGRLVKSKKFKEHKYVGDPINAVKILNEKEVDELIVLDISATANSRPPDIQQIREISAEAFMPLGYGGGVSELKHVLDLIHAGVEKVVLNTSAYFNPLIVSEAAKIIGSQSVVVSIDVRNDFFGKPCVCVHNGKKKIAFDVLTYAKRMEESGAGELILNSIDRDGTYKGYDLGLIRKVCEQISIPVVVAGGASCIGDFVLAIENGASAVSAGSMFVFQRPHNAVLITYPSQKELIEKLFIPISNNGN